MLKSSLSRDGDTGTVMDQPKADERPEPPAGEPERVLRAEELFGDRREVWIELDGVRYRLRITRRGKLILQK
jgi:hemin uptake protein HemP